LIDDEGYELDSDDNEERVQEAIAAAEDENPYASIHLEREYPFVPRLSGLRRATADQKQIFWLH